MAMENKHDDSFFAFAGSLSAAESILLSIEDAELTPVEIREIGKSLKTKLQSDPRNPSGRVRRLELTRLHVELLRWIATHPGRPIRQEAPRALVGHEQHGSLRYWYLVERIAPGRYQPTSLGERFLAGRAKVSAWVDVRRDVVVDESPDDVGIDDLIS